MKDIIKVIFFKILFISLFSINLNGTPVILIKLNHGNILNIHGEIPNLVFEEVNSQFPDLIKDETLFSSDDKWSNLNVWDKNPKGELYMLDILVEERFLILYLTLYIYKYKLSLSDDNLLNNHRDAIKFMNNHSNIEPIIIKFSFTLNESEQERSKKKLKKGDKDFIPSKHYIKNKIKKIKILSCQKLDDSMAKTNDKISLLLEETKILYKDFKFKLKKYQKFIFKKVPKLKKCSEKMEKHQNTIKKYKSMLILNPSKYDDIISLLEEKDIELKNLTENISQKLTSWKDIDFILMQVPKLIIKKKGKINIQEMVGIIGQKKGVNFFRKDNFSKAFPEERCSCEEESINEAFFEPKYPKKELSIEEDERCAKCNSISDVSIDEISSTPNSIKNKKATLKRCKYSMDGKEDYKQCIDEIKESIIDISNSITSVVLPKEEITQPYEDSYELMETKYNKNIKLIDSSINLLKRSLKEIKDNSIRQTIKYFLDFSWDDYFTKIDSIIDMMDPEDILNNIPKLEKLRKELIEKLDIFISLEEEDSDMSIYSEEESWTKSCRKSLQELEKLISAA